MNANANFRRTRQSDWKDYVLKMNKGRSVSLKMMPVAQKLLKKTVSTKSEC